jgi:ribosomal protein S18 acetylase RimI-like enzyme
MMQLRAEHEPEGPHRYLSHLAVHPDFQNRGVGGELVRSFHKGSTFLLSANPANLDFYRRHSFDIVGERLVDPGFTTWALRALSH